VKTTVHHIYIYIEIPNQIISGCITIDERKTYNPHNRAVQFRSVIGSVAVCFTDQASNAGPGAFSFH